MGVLKTKSPPGGVLDVADNATVADLFAALAISDKQVQVVSVNGKFESDRNRALSPGDEIMILPPVGGGQPPSC